MADQAQEHMAPPTEQPQAPPATPAEPAVNGGTDASAHGQDVQMTEDHVEVKQEVHQPHIAPASPSQTLQPGSTLSTQPSGTSPTSATPLLPFKQDTTASSVRGSTPQQQNRSSTPSNTTTTTTMPAGALPPSAIIPPVNASGSPQRVYLNTKVTPALLEGLKYLAVHEPDKPLAWLADFLQKKSAEVEGA